MVLHTEKLPDLDMTIDDIGIQPDYYLDKTIPEYKWVTFATEILKAK